ncbi:MAG: prolyl oligopeptidase family serine peptidase, partial [Myxococcota bacterium]|nr:prolyl oligopeptidase family serine peptidase [Myxococcota bacterium]
MRRRALLVIAALVVLPACASSSGGDADAVTHTCPDEDPTTSGDSCCCWEGIASTYECVDGLWQCQSGQEFTGEMCTDPTGPCWTQVGPEPDAGPSSDTVETPPPAWAEYAAEIPVVKRERAAAEVCADGFVESGFESGQHDGYEAGGQMRGFYLGLPDPALYPGPRPLMLALNGTGGTGLKAYNNYGGAGWVDAGVIFLAPDSNANGVVWPSWYSMIPPGEPDENNPDMLYIDSLLDCASAHLEVDEHRLYVSGHSAGGIMTNYVLQHRPDTFAGGVPASSILDLTAPTPALSMPPMAIIVMWGGDNDIWGGDSEAESVAVPEFDFREQAAIASAFYEGVDGAHQVHCKGADLGHSWVHGADDFVRDFLLAHPKGLAQNPGWVIDDAPAVIEGACSEDVYEYEKAVTVTCDESETEGCQPVCQLLGDCLVENATVAPVLGPPLETIGFDGDDCTGCVTTCEELTGDTADSAMAC